jgi:hypothetical protein
MTDTIRPRLILAVLITLAACGQSEQDRLRKAQQRAAADSSVASSSVVQSLATSQAPGSLIYDKPIDLSYATLRNTRPDLDSANDARRHPTAAAPAPRDTNRVEEQNARRRRPGRP